MNTLEITFANAHLERTVHQVPRLDDRPLLLDGLRDLVKSGIRPPFNEAALCIYYGIMDKLGTDTDGQFQALTAALGDGAGEPAPASSVIADSDTLIGCATRLEGCGGGFWRLPDLAEKRLVIAPADPNPGPTRIYTMSPEFAITTTGAAVLETMILDGFEPETVGYRAEPPFAVFRQRQLGAFFYRYLFD